MLTARDWGRLIGGKIECVDEHGTVRGVLHRVESDFLTVKLKSNNFAYYVCFTSTCRPILRSFDQMTEEENKEFHYLTGIMSDLENCETHIRMAHQVSIMDWFDSIGVDQRGWIEAGLAIGQARFVCQ